MASSQGLRASRLRQETPGRHEVRPDRLLACAVLLCAFQDACSQITKDGKYLYLRERDQARRFLLGEERRNASLLEMWCKAAGFDMTEVIARATRLEKRGWIPYGI